MPYIFQFCCISFEEVNGLRVEYDYESDPVITQMLICAFMCGSITIIIIRNLYVLSAEAKVSL
jgi:hypothetical protein